VDSKSNTVPSHLCRFRDAVVTSLHHTGYRRWFVHILVINSGSSSVKFSIFACDPTQPAPQPRVTLDGELTGIGGSGARLEIGESPRSVQAGTPAEAIALVLEELAKPGVPAIDAVGYRVVHPGPRIDRHLRIGDEVLAQLEAAVAFAPLHNPEAIALIRTCMSRFDHVPHYACFDTIFHQTMPAEATTYPIPLRYRDQGVRRYGFHGLSCESVVHQLRAASIKPERMIIAHLGSGCSVTALRNGESIDNTMGLTPTGGVVMGTRPGDLDPGLIFYLLRQPGASIDSVEHILNHDAGIKALFGTNDMRKLRGASGSDDRARLTIRIFETSIRRAIAGMAAVHGLDAVVFTGGIGEHDPDTRTAAADRLFHDHPNIDPQLNQAKDHGLRKISAANSTIAVYVVPAEEDWMIAVHVARMYASNPQ
jgi:acetate kinase